MSAHDLNLLLMGGGVGVYLALVAAVVFLVVDDFRILRRDRNAKAAKAAQAVVPAPARIPVTAKD